MGRAGSSSNDSSLAGGAAVALASFPAAGAGPRGASAGIGAVNREDRAASGPLSSGVAAGFASGSERGAGAGEEERRGSDGAVISGVATLSTGDGRSAGLPRPLFGEGEGEGRFGSDCRAGEAFRERSTDGAGGGLDGSRRAGAGEKDDLSVA